MRYTDRVNFKEKYIFRLFEYALGLKIFNAVWEIGLAIFIFFDKDIKDSVLGVTSKLISEQHYVFIARYLQNFILRATKGTILFIVIWLFGQGILKIILSIGLLKKKVHAYPIAITFFFVFVFYQIYRWNHTHAPLLLVFSLFDLATILLVQHEWHRLKQHLASY